MSRNITIALAQVPVKNGDKKDNLKKALECIWQSAEKGVDLIAFPELFYTGYDVDHDTLQCLAEPQDGPLFQTLSDAAARHKIRILMGYPELDRDGESVYISVMFIDQKGNLIGNHRKAYMWLADLERVMPGQGFEVFDTDIGKVGLLICYEMEFPEPARILMMKGAELVLISSAFMDVRLMERHISGIAAQNLFYVAGVNHIIDGYKGNSLIVDQAGETIAKASDSEAELLIAQIDLDCNRRLTYPAIEDFNRSFKNTTIAEYVSCSKI